MSLFSPDVNRVTKLRLLEATNLSVHKLCGTKNVVGTWDPVVDLWVNLMFILQLSSTTHGCA